MDLTEIHKEIYKDFQIVVRKSIYVLHDIKRLMILCEKTYYKNFRSPVEKQKYLDLQMGY